MKLNININFTTKDAWSPKPLTKGMFNWRVTFEYHERPGVQETRVIKAKTEEEARRIFYSTARGHDKILKIEKGS